MDALTTLLQKRGIINRLKNTSNRQELNNNASLDASIKKIKKFFKNGA